MQGIWRLPWCSEGNKLLEKAGLDHKIRPSPVVEIPKMVRKRSGSLGPQSPQFAHHDKRQRSEVDQPHQLPTPCSPYMDVAFTLKTEQQLPPPRLLSRSDSSPMKRIGTPTACDEQAVGGAEVSVKAQQTEPQPTKHRSDFDIDSNKGGYFASKPLPSAGTDMDTRNAYDDMLSGFSPLQQVIENEFNMQILMKHNELRVIEQELAKCQIALEQLRRAEIRPYPGSERPELSVSSGTGPAIQPQSGFSRPSHAAPYGVTDGPYSRHYARWLLNDAAFDSTSLQVLSPTEQYVDSTKMSTRNNGHVRKSASKSLGVGTRATDPLQSIPSYPVATPVKDKTPFQVLRRSTDNMLVKLICKDCKRGNFSSIQGFLNHCRIAHKVDYKSHDAAAIDCGQLLEEHEMAILPSETQSVSVPKPKPTPSRAASTTTTVVSNRNLVHPLNTPAGTVVPASRAAPRTPAVPIPKAAMERSHASSTNPFKPSAQLPRLSAHFAKHHLGGDLEQAIASAKQKVDLGAEEDVQSPDTPECASPLTPLTGGARPVAGAHGGRAGSKDANASVFPRPPSRKGYRQPIQRPRPSPLAPAPPGQDIHLHSSALSSPQDLSSAAMSPNTADGNPGLVSDHEDDDHGSPSDDETSTVEVAPAHPLPTVGRSCEDAMDIDVNDDHEIDAHGFIIRRNSMVAAEARGMRAPASPSKQMGGK